jgi:hypothetical protein
MQDVSDQRQGRVGGIRRVDLAARDLIGLAYELIDRQGLVGLIHLAGLAALDRAGLEQDPVDELGLEDAAGQLRGSHDRLTQAVGAQWREIMTALRLPRLSCSARRGKLCPKSPAQSLRIAVTT